MRFLFNDNPVQANFLTLLLAALLWSPLAQAATITKAMSVTSTPPDVGSFNNSGVIDLIDGTYSFDLVISAINVDLIYIETAITQFSLNGNSLDTAVFYIFGGPSGTFSEKYSTTFTITDSSEKIFRWSLSGLNLGGSMDVSGSITGPNVAVPGPEAGAGLGALAMAGVTYLAMKRRRQTVA